MSVATVTAKLAAKQTKTKSRCAVTVYNLGLGPRKWHCIRSVKPAPGGDVRAWTLCYSTVLLGI